MLKRCISSRMRLNSKLALVSVIILIALLYYLSTSYIKMSNLEQQVKHYDDQASKNSASLKALLTNFESVIKQLHGIDRENFKSKEKILELLDSKFNVQQEVLKMLNVSIQKNVASQTIDNQKNIVLETKGKGINEIKKAGDLGLCSDPRPGNKRVISYSLFGPKAEYLSRFIKDVHTEAKGISPYNTFSIRIYFGKTLSQKTREKIQAECPNVRFCDIRKIPKYGDLSSHIGTVWRFVPFADDSLDVFCVRDLDSPLLQRGGDAVNEWFGTNKLMHVMRDRKQHSIPIMGGMWCFRPSASKGMGKTLLDSILVHSNKPGINTRADQTYLQMYVWPKVQNTVLQHDAYFCRMYKGSKPFPTERREYYVGCVRDCWVYGKQECPMDCRPADHKDWKYC